LTARDGVGVGEDAAKTVVWGFFGLSVGLCPDFLTTNAHTSERNLYPQVSFSELEWGHLGAARGKDAKKSSTLEFLTQTSSHLSEVRRCRVSVVFTMRVTRKNRRTATVRAPPHALVVLKDSAHAAAAPSHLFRCILPSRILPYSM
jgi:hypothetical protein